jgi:hypothetical protein
MRHYRWKVHLTSLIRNNIPECTFLTYAYQKFVKKNLPQITNWILNDIHSLEFHHREDIFIVEKYIWSIYSEINRSNSLDLCLFKKFCKKNFTIKITNWILNDYPSLEFHHREYEVYQVHLIHAFIRKRNSKNLSSWPMLI